MLLYIHCVVTLLILSQFILFGDTETLLMALLKFIVIVLCPRFVRLLRGALQILLHNGQIWISGLQSESFRVLLQKIEIVAALLVNI